VWDIPCADAERVPWFDAAHHDRFVLHGAGYSSRYAAGLNSRLHGIYSDDYVATEVLTGHPGMVSQPFGREVVRKYWLTQDLMRGLAMRTIEDVRFASGNIHRQHVRWSGGGEVWVNRGEEGWLVYDSELPRYGFLARVPTSDGPVVASIQRRDGIIVEQSSSPLHFYVNARQVVGGPYRIRATLSDFEAEETNRWRFLVVFQADDPIPDGYRPFFHFVDKDGEIAFHAHQRGNPLAQRRSGSIRVACTVHLPHHARPEEQFDLWIGLFNPSEGGQRLMLVGADDGQRRYPLGLVRLMGEGDRVTGARWTPPTVRPDLYLARQNAGARPVDFGPVITAGGCRLSRQGDVLQVTPLPESGSAGTAIEIRWDELPWELPEPTHVEAIAEDGRTLARRPLDAKLRIQCTPEAFAYRFTRHRERQGTPESSSTGR
jgi:hypothetical protein